MQKAYIVLAHSRPEQLLRLIRSLDDGHSYFFIHIDSSASQPPFETELGRRPNCQFIKRESGGWGQIGIVKATLNGLRSVLTSTKQFDVISLLSGQDYPVRSNAYIDTFFRNNPGKIFIEFAQLPAAIWADGGLSRIQAYHFGDRRRRSRKHLSRCLSRLFTLFGTRRRRFPRDLVPYGGWQWWSIPPYAAHAILDFVDRRPDFLRFHKFSLLPDEMFFQTILLNSHLLPIRTNLVNNCLRFVDWDNPNPHTPATITTAYLPSLLASRSLFARKFDAAVDSSILSAIDDYRITEEHSLLKSEGASCDWTLPSDIYFPRSPACPNTKPPIAT